MIEQAVAQFKAAKVALDEHEQAERLLRARITIAEAEGNAEAVSELRARPFGGEWYKHYVALKDAAKAVCGAAGIEPEDLKRAL